MFVSLGQKVKTLRKQLNLTQVQLAERSGLAAVTVFKIENARQNITLRNLGVLAKAFGVEVGELFRIPSEIRSDRG